MRDVVHKDALGQFQFEQARGECRPFERLRHNIDKIGARELHRGNIDRDADALQFPFLPCGALPARALQHPGAERDNQPVFFHDRDEFRRPHHLLSGRTPAHQSFEPARTRSAGSELRLKLQPEFRPGYGSA